MLKLVLNQVVIYTEDEVPVPKKNFFSIISTNGFYCNFFFTSSSYIIFNQ